MVDKRILIEFANPRIRAIDYYWEIEQAAAHVKKNLLGRHKIHLIESPIEKENRLFLEVYLADEDVDKFSPGYHLRGIGKYLLNHFDGFFKKFMVGNRLLYYIDEEELVRQ